jgi:cold shock CspA family protein/ribosome-associated translation inhibitor RaiA
MQLQPTIVFRQMRGTEALEADIRARLAKLETYFSRIVGAHVLVAPVSRHHVEGNRFRVRIDLSVPGEHITVTHGPSLRAEARARAVERTRKGNEPEAVPRYATLAVREAFDAARRRLQDYARRQRGAVKLHEPGPEGRVVRLFGRQGYGFIQDADGREVYFQRASVLNKAFPRLKVGSKVAFVEERGVKGPQASTVRVVS